MGFASKLAQEVYFLYVLFVLVFCINIISFVNQVGLSEVVVVIINQLSHKESTKLCCFCFRNLQLFLSFFVLLGCILYCYINIV